MENTTNENPYGKRNKTLAVQLRSIDRWQESSRQRALLASRAIIYLVNLRRFCQIAQNICMPLYFSISLSQKFMTLEKDIKLQRYFTAIQRLGTMLQLVCRVMPQFRIHFKGSGLFTKFNIGQRCIPKMKKRTETL